MKLKEFFMVMVLILVCTFIVIAAEGTFMWDPNPELDLAGYRLYMSPNSGSYIFGGGNEVASSPAGIEELIYDVPCGETLFFVLTAYDEDGNESGPSNEVSVYSECPDTTPPGSPTGLQCFVGSSGG